MADQPIIVLCGSSRFWEQISAVERQLILAGAITLVTPVFEDPLTDSDLELIRFLHLRKIEMATDVLVVDEGGYVGETTDMEIGYAEALGKPVWYTSAHNIETVIAGG